MRDVSSWAFPIGQLFNIRIRVHLILPLVAIGMIGREYMREGAHPGSWQDAAWLMLLMFVSILLHELGHCFAARSMDGEADEVLLWPLGGLAFCRSLPNNPLAHFVVAAGGPLVNLGLCIVSGLLLAFAFDKYYMPPFHPIWNPYRVSGTGPDIMLEIWNEPAMRTANWLAIFLARFFWTNWILFLFNMVLVGIPFDGGRILQAILWPWMGQYQATRVAIHCGIAVMFLIGLASIVKGEPLLIILAIFVFVSCAQEMTALEMARDELLFGYDFSQGYTSLEQDEPPAPKETKQNFIQRWLAKRAEEKQQREQEEREAEVRRMDELLDKIQKFGMASLTDEEQRFLKRVADRYKNKP